MILKALVELAEREGLMGDLDYQPGKVRWIITISHDGRILGEMADTLRRTADDKSRPQIAMYAIPARSKRTAQDACEFVVEKSEYVLGYLDETGITATDSNRDRRLEERRERAVLRRDLYRAEIQVAAERSGDEGLAALARFLESSPRLGQKRSQVPTSWAFDTLLMSRFACSLIAQGSGNTGRQGVARPSEEAEPPLSCLNLKEKPWKNLQRYPV